MDWDKDLLRKYICYLKSLYEFWKSSHWICSGQNFYSDHLLFERISDSIQDQIDQVAEKFVGIFGEDIVKVHLTSKIICQMLEDKEIGSSEDILKIGCEFEEEFLKFSKELYDGMKEDEVLTLGLDDMIMTIYSAHEEFCYLLGQRAKNGKKD